jgi:hypothetical protein
LLSFDAKRFAVQFATQKYKDKIYRTSTLPVVLCGCGTWSVALREEFKKLRVFEIRELRKLFGPKRDVVRGEWRRLHNEELHGLYSSPNTTRVIK